MFKRLMFRMRGVGSATPISIEYKACQHCHPAAAAEPLGNNTLLGLSRVGQLVVLAAHPSLIYSTAALTVVYIPGH